mmetsp:Transcript_28776/g.92661  ORF Transcript_28776/g.92661 Transcript_28776/m.92661 type:complete len:312 (+) Transcript_28776:290-1225(+)
MDVASLAQGDPGEVGAGVASAAPGVAFLVEEHQLAVEGGVEEVSEVRGMGGAPTCDLEVEVVDGDLAPEAHGAEVPHHDGAPFDVVGLEERDVRDAGVPKEDVDRDEARRGVLRLVLVVLEAPYADGGVEGGALESLAEPSKAVVVPRERRIHDERLAPGDVVDRPLEAAIELRPEAHRPARRPDGADAADPLRPASRREGKPLLAAARVLGFEEVHLDVAQVLRVAQFAAVVFPVEPEELRSLVVVRRPGPLPRQDAVPPRLLSRLPVGVRAQLGVEVRRIRRAAPRLVQPPRHRPAPTRSKWAFGRMSP